MSKSKTKNLWKNIKEKYRLSITNETHLDEVFSIRLSRLKIIIFSCILFLVIFLLIGILILTTPIKHFLPGYLDEKFRGEVVNYALVVDSLTQVVKVQDAYLENIKNILTGEIKADTIKPIDSLQFNISLQELYQTEEEKKFRKDFENEEKYNLSLSEIEVQTSALPNFFPPTKGIITSNFDEQKKHYGVDIATALNEAVVAVLDGTVIFCGYDINVGYVICLLHNNEFMSVYKHNASLLKREGDAVSAGSVIAISGNTGIHTTGNHLHFELWYKRKAVNPLDYIVFN